MEWDQHRIDEAVLALLQLTLQDGCRAWNGHDWGRWAACTRGA